MYVLANLLEWESPESLKGWISYYGSHFQSWDRTTTQQCSWQFSYRITSRIESNYIIPTEIASSNQNSICPNKPVIKKRPLPHHPMLVYVTYSLRRVTQSLCGRTGQFHALPPSLPFVCRLRSSIAEFGVVLSRTLETDALSKQPLLSREASNSQFALTRNTVFLLIYLGWK